MNIYIELTHKFNKDKLRAILSSGQAVVLHRLAIMSKDGDWIIREDTETTKHILEVLSGYGARYRFGAPLDVTWMAGGWSSHFEFNYDKLRVRTDFVSRPPRISENILQNLWKEQKNKNLPYTDIKILAEIKKTNREKDYAVIGELARLMTKPENQLLYSRSAQDLIAIAEKHPDIVSELVNKRPVLKTIPEGRQRIEEELDAERRKLMHKNEERLQSYMQAATKWSEMWPQIQKEIENCALLDAHAIIVNHARKALPTNLKQL